MIELNQYSLPDKIAAEDRLGLFGDFIAAVREREFQERLTTIWLKEQHKRPWINWLECLVKTIGKNTKMAKMVNKTYNSNSN